VEGGLFARASAWARGLFGADDSASAESEAKDGAGAKKRKGKDERELTPAEERKTAAHIQEIKGLLLIALSLWLAVSMVSFYAPPSDPQAQGYNWGGLVGYYYAKGAFAAAGNAGAFLCVLGCAWGVVLVARKEVKLASLRLVAGLCFVLSIACIVQLAVDPEGAMAPTARSPYGPGGWLAFRLTPVLVAKFGYGGLWILLPVLAVVSFMLATEMAFYPALAAFGEWARKRREERGESLVRSVSLWTGRMVLGLWDFLRGNDIGATADKLVAAEAGNNGTNAANAAAVASAPAKPTRTRRQHPLDEDNLIDDDEDVGVHVLTPVASSARPSEPVVAAAGAAGAASIEERVGDSDDGDVGRAGSQEDFELPSPDDESGGVLSSFDDAEAADKRRRFAEKLAERSKPQKTEVQSKLMFEPPTLGPDNWTYPPVSLLKLSEATGPTSGDFIQEQARALEAVLRSYKVEAVVVDAKVGPSVILYYLDVASGTRMNKITSLQQEIAGALKATSVRIQAPIPGKSVVGVEVPSPARRTVRLSAVVKEDAYDIKNYGLPLFLGVDTEGSAIVEDLAKMPHLLVAGTTGSGKSVCVNTILASFLLTRSPQEVKLILIDPKQVELDMFSNIPHLMAPTVTDMRRATAVLNWIVEKMESRYELFRNAKVKNIKGYNALTEDELRQRMGDEWNEERTPRKVHYIVVVIDEFADLMMVSKKEAEQAVMRLAQKSRAVGIHLILATQRPSTDVITGVMKGNLPCRIAFKVNSGVDSRVILDNQGAEKLLGNGDMLYTPPGVSSLKRVQGAFVEDGELQGIVDFVCKDSVQSFSQELVQLSSGSVGTLPPGALPAEGDDAEGGDVEGGGDDGGGFEDALSDPMWDKAVRQVLKSRRGSASMLQRAFGIGYTRASRLLDMMSEAGICSDHKGSKAREVLMTLDQWEQLHGKDPESLGDSNEP
jgi:S-DNA-T family DNA segregation ATPase FtsK/SpoIIIE